MYHYQDSAEQHMTALGYVKMERKPWNVRENDVIILHEWGTMYNLEKYIPVRVTITDKYPEYHRSTTDVTRYTKVSQTTFQFTHKPLDEADTKHLYRWWSTQWHSYDDVEIWRKK